MAESDAADKAVAAAPAPASVSEPLVGERCRCCMAPGPAAKDLSSQYDFMGEKEVYADMLLESFDIRLEKIQSAGWTICEVCIGRLRDSSNFKKQVLYSERCLLQSVGQLPSSGDQKISGDSKMKMVKCESMSDDNDASFLDDDYFDLETDIKEVSVKFEPQPSTSELSNDEDIPLSKMTSTKKKVTTRSSMPMLTISPLKRSSVQKTPAKKTITLKSGVKITSTSGKLTPGKLNLQSSASMKKGMGAVSKMLATASKLGQSPGTKMVLKPGQTKLTLGSTTLKRATVPKAGTKVMVKPGAKLAAAAEKGRPVNIIGRIGSPIKDLTPDKRRDHYEKLNAVVILQNSNILPFYFNYASGLACFYCNIPMKSMELLRNHVVYKHTSDEKFQSSVKIVLQQRIDFYVKVEISAMKCILCSANIDFLEDFKSHLQRSHNLAFHSGFGLGLKPFRYNENVYACGFCNQSYGTFHKANEHINTHFQNYICDQCGQGFDTHLKLRDHIPAHGLGFKCTACGKSYKSIHTLRSHVKMSHQLGYKCPRCGEGFPGKPELLWHMISIHKMNDLMFKCNFCGKSYLRNQSLQKHIRRVHYKHRTHVCEVCNAKFFDKNKLVDHSTVHSGERIFDCKHCLKRFKTSDSLRKHIRIHTNDKRCVCKHCGESFVQHSSLHYHERKHHNKL